VFHTVRVESVISSTTLTRPSSMASTASPFLHREMSPVVDEVLEYSSLGYVG